MYSFLSFSYWKKCYLNFVLGFQGRLMGQSRALTSPVLLVHFCTLVQDQCGSPRLTHSIPVEAEPKAVQLFPHGLDVAKGGDGGQLL